MRGSRVAATIAFILTAQCLPISRPAEAAGPVTAWYRQDNQWAPIMSFHDAEACARAAPALAAKSGAYVDCADGVLPDSATQMGAHDAVSLEVPFNDRTAEPRPEPRGSAERRDQGHERQRTITCSLKGLGAVCKSY